ncbi:hypothetical protein G3435_26265, partial [Pseudomonas sp. MAFF212428]|nr:hypothetical protein [Pseudomonas brassicae]
VPWRSSVQAPALLKAERQSSLYTPVGARLARVLVQPGDPIKPARHCSNWKHPICALSWKASSGVW